MPSNCIIQTQTRLDELHSYGYQRQPVGALRALTSNTNNSNVKQKLLSDDGKVKKYQITYLEPDCTDPLDCGDAAADRCAAGDSNPIQSEYKTIDRCFSSGVIELTDAQYRDLCNYGPTEFTMGQIMGKFDKMARTINGAILTKICGSVGCTSSTQTTAKDLRLIDQNTGVPAWTADVDILADFSDAGMVTSPILIGGRSLLKYDKGVRAGGNNISGVNINQMERFASFYDNQLNAICPTAGRETVIAVAPQIVSYVNYLENVGDFQSNMKFDGDPLSFMRQGEMYNYGIVQDPFTGLVYDMDVIFDPCVKKWKLSFRTHFDTWVLRTTQCFASCFTGILKYGVCPAPALACA